MCPPSSFKTIDAKTQSPIPPTEEFVPKSQVAEAAYKLAKSLLDPEILNHSIRVYLYGKTLAERTKSIYCSDPARHDLLFTACILHDIGTTESYSNGPWRFEIEGADAAVTLLRSLSISEVDAHEVWVAIAVHTTPHVSERISDLSRIVREAVITDFGIKVERLEGVEELKKVFEGAWKRGDIEIVLGDKVVEQCAKKPEKAPKASWPNNLYKAWLEEPEWRGTNKGFAI